VTVETTDAALTIGGVRKVWIGRGMSGLVVAFLLLDSVMKILAVPVVLEAVSPSVSQAPP
jgi:hypothetical protein